MSVKLIAENVLTADKFSSATEQEGEYIGQPIPDSDNVGDFRLLSKGDITDFVYNGTCTGEVPDTTSVIDSVLTNFGDDYFIGGTVEFTSGDNDGETKAVSDFAQATGDLTCAAFSNAVNIGDEFTLTVAYSSRDFRVELITSGDTGDADFKVSHDGGTTWLGRDSPNQAAWLAETAIANTVGLYRVLMCQAANGNWIAFYHDTGVGKVKYITSTDGGLTWSAPTTLSTLIVSPLVVLVLLSDRILLVGAGAVNTRVSYSDDNGVTWASPVSLGAQIGFTGMRELSSGHIIGVYNTGANNIECRISEDGGFTWSPAITIAADANDQADATVEIAENGDIICAYRTDEDANGDDEIKCKVSSDGGATWGSAIDVMDYVANDIRYPSILRDINNYLYVVADVSTLNKLYLAYSDDNGATWNKAAFIDLYTPGGGEDPDFPHLCLIDGHQIVCSFFEDTGNTMNIVKRGVWEAYSANACPCAIEVQEQKIICDVGIIWHGGAGILNDRWQFEAAYDYAMDNIIEDSPLKPWRSEQDNIPCNIVIDLAVNERLLVDGIGFFGCNVRTLDFQMNATDSWGTPSVDESVSFDIATGIVDDVSGNYINDASLMADYKDHALKTATYFLRMTSGTDDGVTWEILDNAGDYIVLDTTAATNIAATDTFVIFQDHVAKTFTGGVYRFIRIAISAQHTADNYYQIGASPMGKAISLSTPPTLESAFHTAYEIEHKYNITMLRPLQGGMIPMKNAERKRKFQLSWIATETNAAAVTAEILALVNYIEGKNIVLIPDSDNLLDCYLVKQIGDISQQHQLLGRFDFGPVVFEEV